MLVYWKRFDKVEKEHRKKAEKEAMEQRKQDEEMREVNTVIIGQLINLSNHQSVNVTMNS